MGKKFQNYRGLEYSKTNRVPMERNLAIQYPGVVRDTQIMRYHGPTGKTRYYGFQREMKVQHGIRSISGEKWENNLSTMWVWWFQP